MQKGVSTINFEGVTVDGCFIFKEVFFLPKTKKETIFKVISFSNGFMEIAIDHTESIQKVAELVSGMFSKKSIFSNLDSVIMNYRNIRLQLRKTNGKKDIINMLMKAMSAPGYKDRNNEISIDTKTCQSSTWLKDSKQSQEMSYNIFANSECFNEIFKCKKVLFFMKHSTSNIIHISSLKDGIITVDSIVGDRISDFITNLRELFVPHSNMYGIKAIELEFNQFAITMDEHNANRILELFYRSLAMSKMLYEKELNEYYSSPKYIRNKVKLLKSEYRKKVIFQKVKNFTKDTDFTIVDKNKLLKWEKFKTISYSGNYSRYVIDYTILWAQCMEYIMSKHNKRLSDIWNKSLMLLDIYDIVENAVYILSIFWKYGEDLRALYNLNTLKAMEQ